MKVFVTGSTGVLGSHAVPRLVAAGHHVTALVHEADHTATARELGAEPVVGDLFDEPALAHAMAGHQAVVNLATHIPTGDRGALPWAWRQDDRIRSRGSAAVVAAARAAGVERIVQESVTFLYPDCGDEWITEQTPIQPVRQQQPTVTAMRHALDFDAEDGRTGVVLRFGQLYGLDPTSQITLDRVRAGKARMFGRPDGWLSPLHPADAATAVGAALDCPGGVYNVNEPPVRRSEWATIVGEAAGTGPAKFMSPLVQRLTGPRVGVLGRSQRVCAARYTELTGWVPQVSCVAGGWTHR